MPLIPIDIPPGIFSDGTDYNSKNYWLDCDKIRFRNGKAEKIGGWTKYNSTAVSGKVRLISQWMDLSNIRHVGVGTNYKYYIDDGLGNLNDSTPLREVPLLDNPITVNASTTTVEVTHKLHGLPTGTRVKISGVSGSVNGIPQSELNAVHTITAVGANTYRFTVATTSGGTPTTGGGTNVSVYADNEFYSPLTLNPITYTAGSNEFQIFHEDHGAAINDVVTILGTDSSHGGSLVGTFQVAEVIDDDNYKIVGNYTSNGSSTSGGPNVRIMYEMASGSENYSTGSGWGAGPWGSGGWGEGEVSGGFGTQARMWSADQFGEDHIACARGGPIFIYDTSRGDVRLYDVCLISGAKKCPEEANFILVSSEDRRVFAFGTNDYTTGTFDPMLIRWSNEESASDWEISDTKTAGFLRLSLGSEIVCAARSKGEILVWTDVALYAIRPSSDFVYGVYMISPNIDILGPSCVVSVDDAVFWLGRENIFVYNGSVKPLQCPVRQRVFSDINISQSYKCAAGSNRIFREAWWFYPSEDSAEADKYLVFNYAENVWYYGNMERTAWSDAGFGAFSFPMASDHDGYIFYHENGIDDGSTTPDSPITAYIESGPLELAEGNKFSFVNRFIPDVTFDGSDNSSPSIDVSIIPKNYPGSQRGTPDSKAVERLATFPVETFTSKKDVRIRGRQIIFKVSSSLSGVMWRLGINRMEVREDGAK